MLIDADRLIRRLTDDLHAEGEHLLAVLVGRRLRLLAAELVADHETADVGVLPAPAEAATRVLCPMAEGD